MRIERMTSSASKKISRVEGLDRISELPEPIILHILSYLPLEDSGRASILSKTWRSYCNLYPILHYDHNIFALQSLVSSKKRRKRHDINRIRDVFMDYVDYQLSRASRIISPIRKLSLTVAISDSKYYYSRIDSWLEFVKLMKIEDLYISVQSVDCLWAENVVHGRKLYELPVSVLGSKGLRSVYIRACKLGFRDTYPSGIVSFPSLQRLCLSHVFLSDDVVEILARCCHGIETLILNSCTVMSKALELSKFPKLKKAVIQLDRTQVSYVDIVDTNLESFKCDADTECRINPDACAGIREFTLMGCTVSHPHVFKDLTATFPRIEEIQVDIHDTSTLNVVSNVLRKLSFLSLGPVCVNEVHVDSPSLTLLNFATFGMTDMFVDCPKLNVFSYSGDTVPETGFFRSAPDLDESSCTIATYEVYNMSWFIKLRAFLELITTVNPTTVSLEFSLPMETFNPEEVSPVPVQASPRYNVNLTLALTRHDMQNVAPLLDAVLLIIRPTTLTIDYKSYYLIKYLCESLVKKSEGKICWLHLIDDFEVETSLDVSDIKQNLGSFPELCRAIHHRERRPFWRNPICFKLRWSSK